MPSALARRMGRHHAMRRHLTNARLMRMPIASGAARSRTAS
jgi:hypothetical protein